MVNVSENCYKCSPILLISVYTSPEADAARNAADMNDLNVSEKCSKCSIFISLMDRTFERNQKGDAEGTGMRRCAASLRTDAHNDRDCRPECVCLFVGEIHERKARRYAREICHTRQHA
jgi:hypothetical protein